MTYRILLNKGEKNDMSLTTAYNSTTSIPTAISSGSKTSSGSDNFHRTKLEDVLSGYNSIYGDNVTILSNNEDCSEVTFTKPKDQFKLVTKIEARMSGKKKFVDTDNGLVMTRTWE